MNAEMTIPTTNLKCQHGISVAQTAWMYENMGYTNAALHMYEQAVNTLSAGIATLAGPAPDDALFHLGASQLRLGCLYQNSDKQTAGRQWIQDSLPHLQEAWRRFPNNPWYQQALVQASLLLGQLATAQEVRELSPISPTVEKIGGWIDQAVKAWDRLNAKKDGVVRPIASAWAQPSNDWSRLVMRDVFNGNATFTGASEW